MKARVFWVNYFVHSDTKLIISSCIRMIPFNIKGLVHSLPKQKVLEAYGWAWVFVSLRFPNIYRFSGNNFLFLFLFLFFQFRNVKNISMSTQMMFLPVSFCKVLVPIWYFKDTLKKINFTEFEGIYTRGRERKRKRQKNEENKKRKQEKNYIVFN